MVILYFETVFRQLDKLLAAILFGVANMTISLHVALEEKAGMKWACWACWFLNVVQRDHCAKQRAGIPMTFRDYIVAGTLLIVLTGLLISVPYCLARAVI